MPIVRFVYGFCGAGESDYDKGRKKRNQKLKVLDESSTFTAPGESLLSPEKYSRLRTYLTRGKDCVVVEAFLFDEAVRQQVVSKVADIQNVQIKWWAYENNLELAN